MLKIYTVSSGRIPSLQYKYCIQKKNENENESENDVKEKSVTQVTLFSFGGE
jgi:hypothetical protein